MLIPTKWGHRMNLFLLTAAGLISVFLGLFLRDGQENTPEVTLASLTLNTTNYTLKLEENRRTFVTANYTDGSNENVTIQSNFSTSNENVVTVNEVGIITAIQPGIASISISYGGLTKKISVSVTEEFRNVNVKDYGALGNGIHDDTAAFQAAIETLAAQDGGDVFVPAGTYILQPILLKPNVNLVGENRDSVILKLSDDAPDDYTRLITMEDNTKVQFITCDGNYQKHPNGIEHMHCIFAYDSNNILIDNNKLMNAVGDGISISGSNKASNYVIISNNIVQENQRSQIVIEQVNHLLLFNNTITSETGRPGIHFEPWEKTQFYDAKITGNTIITNSKEYCVLLAGSDSGMATRDSHGYLFHGIEFYLNTVTGPACSFLIMDTAGAKIYDNTLWVKEVFVWRKNEAVSISKNEIKGINGIRIEGGDNGGLISKGTTISENTISSSKDGIHIHAGAEMTTVTNNHFTGSGTGMGILLFASDDIVNTTISKNSFENYKDGINSSSTGRTSVEGLRISDNTFSYNNGFAFSLRGELHNVKIDKNVVKNSSGANLLVDESMSNITIKKNQFSGGQRGIYQSYQGNGSLKGLTIIGNQISNTKGIENQYSTGAAIELDRTSKRLKDVQITDNTLKNNAINDITVPKSLLKFVKNNQLK